MHKLTRKTVALAAGTVLLLGVSGVAYAYWTSSGSGTGTATTDATTVALTVTQTSTVGYMAPGEEPRTLSGDFNNTNEGPMWVTAVTATGYTIDATHVSAGCTVLGGHYELGGTATVGADVPVGAAQGAWTGLTIKMLNLGTNQDVCKGATVTVIYASS